MNHKLKITHRYDDIIRLSRPVSDRHAPMPAASRAAQFAPFAALTGHDDAIRETARPTHQRPELDEDRKQVLDQRLQHLRAHLASRPQITLTCFCPDPAKAGGTCMRRTGRAVRLDEYGRQLLLEDGTVIPLDQLLDMDGTLFDSL